MTDREAFEKWWLTKFSAEFLDSDNCWSAWTGWQARGALDAELLERIVAWLQDEVANTDMTEGIAEDNEDFLMAGRRECAEGLLGYITTIGGRDADSQNSQ